jgi:SHS2 domain-containing protein
MKLPDGLKDSVESLIKKFTEDGLTLTLKSIFECSPAIAATAGATAAGVTVSPMLVAGAVALFTLHVGLSTIKSKRKNKVKKEIEDNWEKLFKALTSNHEIYKQYHITQLDKIIEGNLQNKKNPYLRATTFGYFH